MPNDHSGHRILETKDGSRTFISPVFNETYHSLHGAVQEGKHVFIEAGLQHFLDNRTKEQLNILEIGFGTGLNLLLTYQHLRSIDIDTNYYGVEKYPVGSENAKKMDYPFLSEEEKSFFFEIHENFDKNNSINRNRFIFHPVFQDFNDINFNNKFDLVYFDAFAPTCQPELWESPFLLKIFQSIKPGGTLVSYGAKGSFKRALKETGFNIESLQGPPGKREMTRAMKNF